MIEVYPIAAPPKEAASDVLNSFVVSSEFIPVLF